MHVFIKYLIGSRRLGHNIYSYGDFLFAIYMEIYRKLNEYRYYLAREYPKY